MMRDEKRESYDGTIIVDATYEFYLRGRDDPIQVPATFQFNADMLDAGEELSDFQSICVNTVLALMDNKAAHRMVFSDRMFNKIVIVTDDVQAVSVLAPSESTIQRAIETGDSSEH
jgi:hypothetical protein